MKMTTVADALEFLLQEVEDHWNDIKESDPEADLNWKKLDAARQIMIEEAYVPAKLQFPTPEMAQTQSSMLPRTIVTRIHGNIVSVRASQHTLDMIGVRPGVKVILSLRN